MLSRSFTRHCRLRYPAVSRIADVVSIGQQLSLKCIGQDLRGNIKLSLKETLPRPGSETNNLVEWSFAHTKQNLNVWTSVGDMPNEQGKQLSALGDSPLCRNEISGISSPSSSPSILIRSAAECDEEETSASLNQNPKSSSRALNPSDSVKKFKKLPSQSDVIVSTFSDSGPFPTSKANKSKLFSPKEREKESNSNFVSDDEAENEYTSASSSHSQDDLNDKEAVVEASINSKNLKLGMKVIAKVHQIRTRGIVLDLGDGIRGMYRFEAGGRRDFEVGGELRVKCSSFTSKGIPVMSMVEDE